MAHAKLSPSARPRVDARRTGKLRYIGRLCQCGRAERYTSTGKCVVCTLTQSAERPRTPEYRRAQREAQRERNAFLRGHAPPPREEDCPPRSTLCQSCGESAEPESLRLDHDHSTGAFRGWCCDGCNTGFKLADSARLCRLRALYLDHAAEKRRAA